MAAETGFTNIEAEIADELVAERRATGRALEEILDAMVDEGYLDCDDAGRSEILRLAKEKE